MASTLVNRTGETHGAATVLGRNEKNPRRWDITWSCCGTTQDVSSGRVGTIARFQPDLCPQCALEEKRMNFTEYQKREAVRKARLREQAREHEEQGYPVVRDATGYPWPEISRPKPKGDQPQ